MKFKLITRNYWSDFDLWTGKKKGFKVELETPYRKNHKDMSKYFYKITSPDGSIKTSIKDNKYFDSLDEVCKFSENWIDATH